MTLINIKNINLIRNRQKILDNVSLTVNAGDFITVVGPNGAGKTTLLKCLLGLLTPDSGSIERQADSRIGYVPQRINPAHTLPLRLRRFLTLNNTISTDEMMQVAALTGITANLDKPLTALSGGEMQRALLARALACNPTLLALDEPTQNLDISGEIAFYRLLDTVCEQRKLTVVMVSHDLHFVMRRSQQVVCLYHHICCSGAPQIVSKNPEFEALFGKDAMQLLAVYNHQHNHAHHHNDFGCAHD